MSRMRRPLASRSGADARGTNPHVSRSHWRINTVENRMSPASSGKRPSLQDRWEGLVPDRHSRVRQYSLSRPLLQCSLRLCLTLPLLLPVLLKVLGALLLGPLLILLTRRRAPPRQWPAAAVGRKTSASALDRSSQSRSRQVRTWKIRTKRAKSTQVTSHNVDSLSRSAF